MGHDIRFELEYGPFTATRYFDRFADTPQVPEAGTVLYVLIEHYTEGSTFHEPIETCEVNSWHLTFEGAESLSKTASVHQDYFGKHLKWRIEVVRLGGE